MNPAYGPVFGFILLVIADHYGLLLWPGLGGS